MYNILALLLLVSLTLTQVHIAEFDGSAVNCKGKLYRTWTIPTTCVLSNMEGDIKKYAFSETNPIQVYKCPTASCIKSECTPLLTSAYQNGKECTTRFYEITPRSFIYSTVPFDIPPPTIEYFGYSDDTCEERNLVSPLIKQRASSCHIEPSWGQLIGTRYTIRNASQATLDVYDANSKSCGSVLKSQVVQAGMCSSVGYTTFPYTRKYVSITSKGTSLGHVSMLLVGILLFFYTQAHL